MNDPDFNVTPTKVISNLHLADTFIQKVMIFVKIVPEYKNGSFSFLQCTTKDICIHRLIGNIM